MFKAIVIVLIIASAGICRINLPEDNQFAIRASAPPVRAALVRIFAKVGVVKVHSVRDYGIAKLGVCEDQHMLLLPFTKGWQVL